MKINLEMTDIKAVVLSVTITATVFLTFLLNNKPIQELVIPITKVTIEQPNSITNDCQQVIVEEYNLTTGLMQVVRIIERCDD